MTDRLQEPLQESAALAHALAAQYCVRDSATGESCAWYHGLWQVLRLMRLVETPEYHAAFFFEALASHAPPGRRARVLVSGTADYSMLAHVLAAYPAGSVPEVTVVDRCETPLALSRWYAGRAGVAIETKRCDILQYRPAEPFDALCTHAFFGRFSPAERPVLAERWRELLRPGGIAVSAAPLRPGAAAGKAGFGEADAARLRDTVRERAAGLREALGLPPEALAAEAARYAARHRVYPVRDLAELRDLFASAGFDIAHLVHVPAVPGVLHEVRGPTIVGSADYARLVAVRR